MTQWLLVWIAGGTLSGLSLPSGEVFSEKEQCEAAAEVLENLSGRQAMRGTVATVVAACVQVEAS